jgi:dTMP kinase
MQKLIVITGADGTGKTTLIKQLATKYKSCYCANIWDLLQQTNNTLPFKSKKDIYAFLCALTPNSRLLFLAHALRYSLDKAMQADEEIILMDSYYYKYFASELALGADSILVKSIIDSFPKADLVIELTLPLAEVLKRKTTFSRYECGVAETVSKQAFEHFQLKVWEHWKRLELINHYSVNAMGNIEQVADKAFKIVENK